MGEFDKLFKNEKQSVYVNGGVSTASLLGIAFIVLKLTGIINWSWWWVLAPFWIPICLILILAIILVIILAWAANKASKEEKKLRETIARSQAKANEQKKETPVVKKPENITKEVSEAVKEAKNPEVLIKNSVEPTKEVAKKKVVRKKKTNTEDGGEVKRKNKKSSK